MSAPTRRGHAVITDLEDNDDFLLETPYREAFIGLLKETIPPEGRAWDPSRQAWVVDYDYFLKVMDLVAHYFQDITIQDAGKKYVYTVTWGMGEIA